MDEVPVNSIRVECPHCRATLICPLNLIDRNVRCPKCGKQYHVRLHSSPPQPPPPPSSTEIPPTRAPELFKTPFNDINISSIPVIRASNKPLIYKKVAKTRQQLLFWILLSILVFLLFLILIGQLSDSSDSQSGGGQTSDLIMSLIGVPLFFGGLLLYFVPSVVAYVREHQNVMPIFVLNLFFGWTFLGWVICLAWAFSSDVRESRQYIKQVIVKENDQSH